MDRYKYKNSLPSGISDKEKISPKVICSSLDEFANKYVNKDVDKRLDELQELIFDRITSESQLWIGRLLADILRDIGNDGYKVKQLPAVMQVLEFLAWRARDFEEYQEHLERMLKLCALPPLLQNTSESLNSAVVLEQYFTMLGYLMAVLPTDREVLIVCEAINRLLVRSEPAHISAVQLELSRRAMEKSRLPIIITQLVEISSPIMYLPVLELAYLLVTISCNSCYKMLETGMLDHVLIRMDPTNRINEPELYKEEIIVATNILWTLMQSIISPNEFAPSIQNLPGPSTCAMRSLKNAFRRQVSSSHGSNKSLMLRNDLAVVILEGLVALPSWQSHLVRCGLAEDLIILSVATESEINDDSWLKNIKFGASNEDLFFKKIMLSILCHLSNRGAAIAIMRERRVMPAILQLINPIITDTKKLSSPAQFRYLSQLAMATLARLAPKMPREFILHNGSFRLRTLVEWSLTVEFDSQMVLEIIKTTCCIITPKCSHVIAKFREEEITASLIELVNRILTFDRLTMQHQRILTLIMIAIQDVTKTEERSAHKYKGQSLQIVVQLLRRCFYRTKEDFQLDQRLLITIGSYIWNCVVPCPVTIREFVDSGGIYMILDVIERAIFPVRCIYLGILTDISFGGYGVAHLCTWRGVDKTKGFVSLLARSWREEEIRTGVKRTPDGCIEDVELPIMGTEQWIHAFHARSTHDSSPALASMIGSVRPKIYSIRKIIINESDRFEKSNEHYKILFNDTPVEDLITMYIADHLYRFAQGQLWSEVSRYVEQVGVNLLGMDGEITFLMNQRHRDWGMYVRGLQDKILIAERKKETVRELEEISRIRNSKLGSSLSALEEMDYIRRTTDREYMIAKKKTQRARVDAALRFPRSFDAEHCHETFADKWNWTTILEQYHTIPSVPLDSRIAVPLSVSPANSRNELLTSLSEKINDSETAIVRGQCRWTGLPDSRKKSSKRISS